MSISSKLTSAWNAYIDFSLKNLDYWSNPNGQNLAQKAISAPINALADRVKDAVTKSTPLTQRTAGWGMGVMQLLGGIPISFYEIFGKNPIPHPGYMLYKLNKVSLTGMWHGAKYVYAKASEWSNGSLNRKSDYELSHEVTMVLGTVVLLGAGVRGVVKGVGIARSQSSQTNIPTSSPAVVKTQPILKEIPITPTSSWATSWGKVSPRSNRVTTSGGTVEIPQGGVVKQASSSSPGTGGSGASGALGISNSGSSGPTLVMAPTQGQAPIVSRASVAPQLAAEGSTSTTALKVQPTSGNSSQLPMILPGAFQGDMVERKSPDEFLVVPGIENPIPMFDPVEDKDPRSDPPVSEERRQYLNPDDPIKSLEPLTEKEKKKLEEFYQKYPELKKAFNQTDWSSEQQYQLLVNVEEFTKDHWSQEQKYHLLTLLARKDSIPISSEEIATSDEYIRLQQVFFLHELSIKKARSKTVEEKMRLADLTVLANTHKTREMLYLLYHFAETKNPYAISLLEEASKTDELAQKLLSYLTPKTPKPPKDPIEALFSLRDSMIKAQSEEAKIYYKTKMRSADLNTLNNAKKTPEILYLLDSFAEANNFKAESLLREAAKTDKLAEKLLTKHDNGQSAALERYRNLRATASQSKAPVKNLPVRDLPVKDLSVKQLYALANRGRMEAAEELIQRSKTDVDAIFSLQNLTKGQAPSDIKKFAEENYAEAIKNFDLKSLAKTGYRDALQQLYRLAQAGHPKAIPLLAELAKTHKDAVRKLRNLTWGEIIPRYKVRKVINKTSHDAMKNLDVTFYAEGLRYNRENYWIENYLSPLYHLSQAGNVAAREVLFIVSEVDPTVLEYYNFLFPKIPKKKKKKGDSR